MVDVSTMGKKNAVHPHNAQVKHYEPTIFY
jgi:hypothetical protein